MSISLLLSSPRLRPRGQDPRGRSHYPRGRGRSRGLDPRGRGRGQDPRGRGHKILASRGLEAEARPRGLTSLPNSHTDEGNEQRCQCTIKRLDPLRTTTLETPSKSDCKPSSRSMQCQPEDLRRARPTKRKKLCSSIN